MNNSSYLVKPELYQNQAPIEIEWINAILSVKKDNHGLQLETNIHRFVLEFFENGTLRFTTYHKDFDLTSSLSMEKLKYSDFEMNTFDHKSIVFFQDIEVVIQYNPFIITVYKNKKLKFTQKAIGFSGDNTYLILERHKEDYIYGLGEKTGFLNKNNEKTVNWNKDVFEPHTRSNKELYQSINMFSYFSKKCKYGIFIDSPSRCSFDFASFFDDSIITTDIGKLDYYLFTDDTLKAIIKSYTQLSGKTLLPPIWALGYHQSRHSYESVDKLLEIYHQFKKREIPLDAIYLDILYMDAYKVFTFNPNTYKEIKATIKTLKDDGVRIVPIVDPGVKVERNYNIYETGLKNDLFCKRSDGTIYTGEVWPGESAFYDFMDSDIRDVWGQNHQFYTQLGIEGIWNDMNEPAIFNSENNTMDKMVLHHTDTGIKNHQEVHNLYGLGMSMATHKGLKTLTHKRPFVLTRSGYAGIQKYAFVWTGDNRSSWEHMEMSIPMCLNLNMSGVSLCGADVGGFMDDCTEEMLIRWTEMGCFFPFFRNHSSIGLRPQEPWTFGKECEGIIKKYIQIRYMFIYFIYSEVFKSHLTGVPVMRPLVLEYETDELTHSIHDEFLLGSNLLVAPILRPGETCRKVYLPEGNWYHFFTNEKYIGGKTYLVYAQLDEIPVFVKEGSILPLTNPVMNTGKLDHHITISVYGDNFTDYFIVDDGKNINHEYNEVIIQVINGEVQLNENKNSDCQYHYEFKQI